MKYTLLFLIWLIATSFNAWALSPDEARHLLHRTGYGVDVSQWNAIIDMEIDDAVDHIVDHAVNLSPPEALAWIDRKPYYTISQKGWSQDKRRKFNAEKRTRINELKAWWLQQMFTTSSPLQERMVMFWSNHFTTEFNKISYPILIHLQHMMYREHALNRFDTLLREVLRDPAMLLYLDNDKNNKGRINENLARELLELFTLGEGEYSETDIKEAARCLTGWGVDKETGNFALRTKRHDSGVKTILGQRGNFGSEELVDILLDYPKTAEFVVRKLWLEFISLDPDLKQVAMWAKQFKEDGYRVDNLLKTMFKSSVFWDAKNRGTLIKSPTEMLAGLIRPALDGQSKESAQQKIESTRFGKRLAHLSRAAGQDLFNPPNVKGWPGGLKWIDSRTLLMREQLARRVVMGLSGDDQAKNPYFVKLHWPAASSQKDARLMWQLNALTVVGDVPITYAPRRVLLEVVGDPTLHLK